MTRKQTASLKHKFLTEFPLYGSVTRAALAAGITRRSGLDERYVFWCVTAMGGKNFRLFAYFERRRRRMFGAFERSSR